MDSATSRGMTANIFVALKWKWNQTSASFVVGFLVGASIRRTAERRHPTLFFMEE